MALLTLSYENRSLDVIPLREGETYLIGRDTASDVQIDDLVVSFHHAKVETHGKAFFLVDLNSENGTFVNGKRIDSLWLNDNDTITVGNHELLFSNPLNNSIPEKQKYSVHKTIPIEPKNFIGIPHLKNLQNSKVVDSKGLYALALVSLPDRTILMTLGEKPIIFGKSKDSDIVVKVFGVAKKAAVIKKLKDGWHLHFLRGLIRPKVNELTVKKSIKLREFDIISFRAVRFQLMANVHQRM
jgi:pSer/pThr/pTyr-binding forkhead associated (FHA) protein